MHQKCLGIPFHKNVLVLIIYELDHSEYNAFCLNTLIIPHRDTRAPHPGDSAPSLSLYYIPQISYIGALKKMQHT